MKRLNHNNCFTLNERRLLNMAPEGSEQKNDSAPKVEVDDKEGASREAALRTQKLQMDLASAPQKFQEKMKESRNKLLQKKEEGPSLGKPSVTPSSAPDTPPISPNTAEAADASSPSNVPPIPKPETTIPPSQKNTPIDPPVTEEPKSPDKPADPDKKNPDSKDKSDTDEKSDIPSELKADVDTIIKALKKGIDVGTIAGGISLNNIKAGYKAMTPEQKPKFIESLNRELSQAGHSEYKAIDQTGEISIQKEGPTGQPEGGDAAIDKKNRPAPTTEGQRLENNLRDAMDELSDPTLDGVAKFAAAMKMIGTLVEYITRATKGTLDEKIKKETPAGPDGKKDGNPSAAPADAAGEKVADQAKKTPDATPVQNIDTVKANNQVEREKNKTDIADLNKTIEGKKKETVTYTNERDALKTELTGLQGKDGSKAKQESLTAQITALDEKIAANNKLVTTLEKQRSGLDDANKKLDEQDKALDDLKKKGAEATKPETGKPESSDKGPELSAETIFAKLKENTLSVLDSKIAFTKTAIKQAEQDINSTDMGQRLDSFFKLGGLLGKTIQGSEQDVLNMAKKNLQDLENAKQRVNIIPDGPQKLDALQSIRAELGLPKMTQELAGDYDKFQKMVAEGVDNKTIDMNYLDINKSLADADAYMAGLEMAIKAADTGASFAVNAVPGGGKVYSLARNATGVLTGEFTPEQAATNFAMDAVMGKIGAKAFAKMGGDKVVAEWVKKNVQKFANKETLAKIVKMAGDYAEAGVTEAIKFGSNTINTAADISGRIGDGLKYTAGQVVENAPYVAGMIGEGAQYAGGKIADGADYLGRQIGEGGYQLWESTVYPGLQKLGTKGQEAIATVQSEFKLLQDGIAALAVQATEEGFDNIGKEYKRVFSETWSPVEKALVSAGVNPDAIQLVKKGFEDYFDAGVKTANEIREKGVVTVAKEFGSDLGIIGKDTYNEHLAPYVKIGGEKIAQAEATLKQISDGAKIIYADAQQHGFDDAGKQYMEQFDKAYGPSMIKVETLLTESGVMKPEDIAAIKQGVKKGFIQGIQTANAINEKGIAIVFKEFTSDLGTLSTAAYEEMRPTIENLTAQGKQTLETAQTNLGQIRDGIILMYKQNPATTAEDLKTAYGKEGEKIVNSLMNGANVTREQASKLVTSVIADLQTRFGRAG